ncbi:hypothetical protein [Burkholderia sola]|uniref:hypothetical protein n=1 Tax=Burkholderia sola TaxID=2843302 RepID=UPI00338ECCBD
MNYQTLDDILIDTETYEAFEVLAESRCMSSQELARELITDAVRGRRRSRRAFHRLRRGAERDDDLDELVVPPDPNDEPASTRLFRAQLQPL